MAFRIFLKNNSKRFNTLLFSLVMIAFVNVEAFSQMKNQNIEIDNAILALNQQINKSLFTNVSVDKNDLNLVQQLDIDKLYIKSNNYKDEIVSVFISDDLGKEVSFFNLKLDKSQTEIDLKNITKGTYFVSVFNSRGKILKSNQLVIE